MPGLVLDMDQSDVESDSRATRRRSTRDRKPTAAFSPASSATKRKRGEGADVGDDVDMDDASDDEEEDEDDEEEAREKRRRSRKSASGKAKQPAAKKAKKSKADTNGEVVNLAIRPAAGGKRRPRKDASAVQVGGIYGMPRRSYDLMN